MRKARGERTMARPIATRCRWPPESCAGLRESSGAELEALRRLAHLGGDLLLRHAAHAQPEADVLGDRQVRIERVGLEDHRDVALARREVVRHFAADQDAALGDVLQARPPS